MTSDSQGNPRGQLPPDVQITQTMTGHIRTGAYYAAVALGIPDLLAEGPKDVEFLATSTGSHKTSLMRLLRFLVGEGVFDKDDQGRYGLTDVSNLLRSDVAGSHYASTLMIGSPSRWAALAQLSEGIKNGVNAFKLANGKSLFEYMDEHEDEARIFNEAMTNLPASAFYRSSLDFDFSGTSVFIDVGGGQGNEVAAVLQKNPDLEGVLFDRPNVVEGAPSVLREAGVESRCRIEGGDFFEFVPSGGDVYNLSNILDDWPDESCLTILANCRRTMSTGAKLLVNEGMVPEDNSPSITKLRDIQMLAFSGGQQRTLTEYRELLEPSGFTVVDQSPRLVVAEAR